MGRRWSGSAALGGRRPWGSTSCHPPVSSTASHRSQTSCSRSSGRSASSAECRPSRPAPRA
eukprot:5059791-Lingulodinium_polyedra.AAC.1